MDVEMDYLCLLRITVNIRKSHHTYSVLLILISFYVGNYCLFKIIIVRILSMKKMCRILIGKVSFH